MIDSRTDRVEHVTRGAVTFRGIAPLILGAALLAGCETAATTTPTTEAKPTVEQPTSTNEDPAPPEKVQEAATVTSDQWLGTWSGVWPLTNGGGCPSTITVKEVTGTQAVATYVWGSGCGGSMPGQHTDPKAKLSGNNLEVALLFGRRARYTMLEDGNLNGVWSSRGRVTVLNATFSRQ